MLDASQIIFNKEFVITDKVSVRHSTVGDVIRIGEEHYLHVVSTLTGIPSDAKSVLYDLGVDWVEMSDLEFFALSVQGMSKEDTSIFLPNLDFSKFKLYKRSDGVIQFADKENGVIIDELVYRKIMECLCTIHKIKKKPEKPGDALVREWLIEEDRDKRRNASLKPFKSKLLPLISAMINRPNFKYNYETIGDLLYGQFMDSVTRVQMIISADQLIQGCYAGNIDTKKLDKKKLDWTRDIA